MSDQSEANPKITQVADPRFKRLNDAFAKYLLAKEDHIGFLEDFVKAVIDHTPADVPAHEVKSLVHRNVELYREHAKEKAGFPGLSHLNLRRLCHTIPVTGDPCFEQLADTYFSYWHCENIQ